MIRNPITLKANAKFNTATTCKKNAFHEMKKSCISRVSSKIGKYIVHPILPNARKVAARLLGDPGTSPSLKNAINCGSNDTVTRVVSRNV